MKKAIILLFIFFILLSCKYKITSPNIQYECGTIDNINNNNLYTVGANSTVY